MVVPMTAYPDLVRSRTPLAPGPAQRRSPAARPARARAVRSARRPRRGLLALLAAEMVLALLGGWQFIGALTGDPGNALEVDGVTYRVTHVEQVTGLTTEDLSGMSHGIQGLVTDGETLIRVRLTISAPGGQVSANSAEGVAYDPSRLLAFVPGVESGHPPLGGSIASGLLTPGASIEGLISYVLPRTGQAVTLGVPGGQRIHLATLDVAPGGAQMPAHDHSGMSGHSDMGDMSGMSGMGGMTVDPSDVPTPAVPSSPPSLSPATP